MCVQALVFLCVCNCTHMTEGHARHLALNNDFLIQIGIRRIAYTAFFINLDLYSYYLTLLTAFLFFCDIHTPSTCAGVSAAQGRATYVCITKSNALHTTMYQCSTHHRHLHGPSSTACSSNSNIGKTVC